MTGEVLLRGALAAVFSVGLGAGCDSGAASDDESAGAETSAADTTTAAASSTGADATTGADEDTATTGAADSESGGEPADPLAELDRFTAEDAQIYLGAIAPMVVGRLLTDAERNIIEYFGGRGIVSVLEGWLEDPAFPETVRMMFQVKLHASGMTEEVDLELPGNLAALLAREDRPFAEILTADHCVDGAGDAIPCDTGAPFNAGVLTTRAYLLANASRFNLQRARRMMYIFNCLQYPMDTTLQPPLAKESLIPMFRALTPEEQEVPEAANGFGNGFACYNCHSQFGAHAQLFVKFDEQGLYHADATGLQDPDNELGRSLGGLFVSHFVDPVAATQELSQVFGIPVENLREAAEVLSSHPTFYQCGARNVIEWTFGLTEAEAAMTEQALLTDIAARALAADAEPSIGDLFRATLTHPDVIDVVLSSTPSDTAIPGAQQ